MLITGVLLFLAPMLGLLLALLGAWDRSRSGREAARNWFLALAAIGAALLWLPGLQFGLLQLLFG